MKTKYIQTAVIAITAFLVTAFPVGAATAVLVIDTADVNINAIEATLNFPSGVIINSISFGSSVITMWLEKPEFDASARTVSFSGITPGGFRGKHQIMTLEGNFTFNDLELVQFTEVRAIENESNANIVPVTFNLSLTEKKSDVTPPEPFVPELSSSTEVFDEKPFLSFLAQDKDTGVSHYEVATSSSRKPKTDMQWMIAESPIILQDEKTFIFIKAVDSEGNQRIERYPERLPVWWYKRKAIWFIIVAMLILIAQCLVKEHKRG